MRQQLDLGAGRAVLLMDSISLLTPGDEGAIVVSASHGGVYVGELAAPYALKLVTFNDAGIGKDSAGTAGLKILERSGIAACTCASTSARIGDVDDHWRNGVVSVVNEHAAGIGIRAGMTLREAVDRAASVAA
ncbi:hypothetical protein GCM10009775_07970 [Microbacterium aoyamense]|uniref:Uncharacterized protein n=1 Tax=Microbacterium aoyamense TaxID=344166 RepID=A0ABN2PDT8_9MICO|nr:hypothetical protein [Microbacterium aoyamense]